MTSHQSIISNRSSRPSPKIRWLAFQRLTHLGRILGLGRDLLVQYPPAGGFRIFAICSLIFNMILNKQTQFQNKQNFSKSFSYSCLLVAGGRPLSQKQTQNQSQTKPNTNPKQTDYKPTQSQLPSRLATGQNWRRLGQR